MRYLLGFVMLAMAACSSPSVGFMGVEPVTVVVEGWTIDVYALDGKAEAIRMTTDWDQSEALMRERGLIAVEQATGWVIDRRTIKGDGSIVRMSTLR
jgi:hypothetical protein